MRLRSLTCNDPTLLFFLNLLLLEVASAGTKSEKFQGISDELTLDFVVQWAISTKTWAVVHLQKYRLTFVVKHNVKT